MPKPRSKNNPFETARAFYGPAFHHTNKRELAQSIAEWAELDEDEQSFTVAHLLYLNLQQQAAGQRLVTQVRELVEEVVESLIGAIEASLPEDPDPDPEPEPHAAGVHEHGGIDVSDSDPDGYRVATPVVEAPETDEDTDADLERGAA